MPQALVEAGRAAFVQGVGNAVLIGCAVLAVVVFVVFVASSLKPQATIVAEEALAVA